MNKSYNDCDIKYILELNSLVIVSPYGIIKTKKPLIMTQGKTGQY